MQASLAPKVRPALKVQQAIQVDRPDLKGHRATMAPPVRKVRLEMTVPPARRVPKVRPGLPERTAHRDRRGLKDRPVIPVALRVRKVRPEPQALTAYQVLKARPAR